MEQQHFVARGKNVFTASDRGDEIPAIPTGVYVVDYNPMAGGFFLRRQADMTLPEKLYGTVEPRARKVLNTFNSRTDKNTGVLLSGNKGSGKTLLSRTICALALEEDKPVLLIEEAYMGTEFNQFMNSITQPVVVFIDEFEKKYNDHDKQNGLLSLLDGTGVNNKLFLATTNDGQVSEFLLSRPSRFFYHWRYVKLEEEVLLGYCNDVLVNKDFLPKIRVFWGISTDMSFDVLQSVVEELNRYPDANFVDLILDMNVTLGEATRMHCRTTKVTWGDEELKVHDAHVMVDLVAVHEGSHLFNIGFELDNWKDMATFISAMGKSNCYHYNRELVEISKEREPTEEDLEDFETPFKAYLRLDTATDTFSTTKGARFERQIDGKLFTVTIEPMKAKTEKDMLERLFS